MACLGIHHGGIEDSLIRNHHCDYRDEQSHHVSGFKHNVVKLTNHRVNKAMACDSDRRSAFCSSDKAFDLQTKRTAYSDYDEYNDRASIESARVSEKLDEWMRNSVREIVKNIKQAPLLIQIYADGEMTTKKSVPEDWPGVSKHRSSLLDGVIIVEELRDDTDLEEDEDGIRAFGVVIQGKMKGRDECKSRCYLLKTSSVNGGGLGHICTHFCLMKVRSFHTSASSQLNECWLV
ncbi:hypothetical protein R6Q59_019732 [Mikania micrantha]|uniref:DUF7804 domain-containing protein n=1 Tax=Mikania micrantha TaxID=192012 RepID=A0A5N6PU90_9ASTR|nr:hypothetical protein E3N88_07385 [Mikania micrantha]